MNIYVQIFLCENIFSFLLGVYLGKALLGHVVTLCVAPGVIAMLFSKVVASSYITQSVRCLRAPVSHTSINTCSACALFWPL